MMTQKLLLILKFVSISNLKEQIVNQSMAEQEAKKVSLMTYWTDSKIYPVMNLFA